MVSQSSYLDSPTTGGSKQDPLSTQNMKLGTNDAIGAEPSKLQSSRGVSMFTWLKQKALEKNLQEIDINSDNLITASEIVQGYEKDNQYTATKGEITISEVIVLEADSDGDHKMTIHELYKLIFGEQPKIHEPHPKGLCKCNIVLSVILIHIETGYIQCIKLLHCHVYT